MAAVRVRGKSPGSGWPLGAHLLPGLRRLADRTLRLRHQAAAHRIGRALSFLQPADPRHLVVALLLIVAQGAGAGGAPAAAFDSVVLAGIRQGVYPGAALIVGRHDTILLARGYGRFT